MKAQVIFASRIISRSTLICTLPVYLLTTTAMATAAVSGQMSAPTSEQAMKTGDLEEVIVTSRKRAESLQDVPISVSAFTGADLEARHIRSLDHIAAFTPNLSFNPSAAISGSNSAAAVYIRGIGQSDFSLNSDPGVGIYVDGVFYARSVGSVLNALDLERVEVLRGPQGTLFGRNTIGGAINIITQRPAEEFGGKIEVATGTDRLMRVHGSVDLPLNAKVLSKFSILYTRQDGYVDKVLEGIKLGDTNSLTGRARFLFKLADNFDFDLGIDGTHERENGAPLTLVANNENASFPAFYNATQGAPCVPSPGSLTSPQCYNSQWVPKGNHFITYATGTTRSNLDQIGVNGTFTLRLDDYQIKSITAYRNLSASFGRDEDHSPILIAETLNSPFKHNQFSQEFQFNGSSFHDRLSWVTGLYYFQEKGRDVDNVTFDLVALQSGGRINNRSYAAFGEVDFKITEQFILTGGLRYSHDKKGWQPDQFVKSSAIGIPPGTRVQPTTEQEISISQTTPHLVFKYHPNKNLTAYISYSKGYKSGGFSQRIFPPRPDVPSFKPEYAEVYEFGIKYTGLEDRLRVNASTFYTNYKDMQLLVSPVGTPGTITANAAAARIKGVELEVLFRPIRQLTLQGGLGYLNGRYKDVDLTAVAITTASKLTNSPEWSLNGSIAYNYDQLSAGDINLRADWSYTSKTYMDAANTPALLQAGYHVVNSTISFHPKDGGYEFYASVQNVFDKTYFTGGYADMHDLGIAEAAFARPRNWTVGAKVSF
jgi:iron complex outermembrane receptor protein